jgi:hypothetical protein
MKEKAWGWAFEKTGYEGVEGGFVVRVTVVLYVSR